MQVVPESELETELETADSLHPLHKIDLEVPSVADSIQSSTSCQGRLENGQETWQHCQVTVNENLVHKDASTIHA